VEPGEGIKAVAVLGAIGVAGFGFLAFAAALAMSWTKQINRTLTLDAADDARAAAFVPEFAAARMHDCGCRNCRLRYATEPCSDFDGD
jgi:hypothetical protein